MKLLALLVLAGGAGTLARFGMNQLMSGFGVRYATLAVNAAGSFGAGFLWVFLLRKENWSASLATVLLVGFFGAFTTFSTMILETGKQLESGNAVGALFHLLLQNGLGILMLFAGIYIARLLFGGQA